VSADSAGVSRDLSRKRCGLTPHRFQSLVLTSILALGIGVLSGCANGDAAPDRLLDGSEAGEPPFGLEGVEEPAVLTKVRVVQPSARDRAERSASCLERGRGSSRPKGPSVERIGVYSETVTFEEKSGRAIFGCDDTAGPREGNQQWCGSAYGQLYGGQLRDPRLDIGCRTEGDEMVGFIWIQPATRVRYVSVEQPGYVEVYEIGGGLPIRVATRSGIRVEGSRATFDLFEHDADGRLLRKHRLEAAVAG
jgi:hypothetical protein